MPLRRHDASQLLFGGSVENGEYSPLNIRDNYLFFTAGFIKMDSTLKCKITQPFVRNYQ